MLSCIFNVLRHGSWTWTDFDVCVCRCLDLQVMTRFVDMLLGKQFRQRATDLGCYHCFCWTGYCLTSQTAAYLRYRCSKSPCLKSASIQAQFFQLAKTLRSKASMKQSTWSTHSKRTHKSWQIKEYGTTLSASRTDMFSFVKHKNSDSLFSYEKYFRRGKENMEIIFIAM